MNRDWKIWFKLAGIRAAKTVCQTALGVIGTATLFSEINILEVISAAILAGIVSLLTSLKGIPEEITNTFVYPEGYEETTDLPDDTDEPSEEIGLEL